MAKLDMMHLLYNSRTASASSLNLRMILPRKIRPWLVNLNLVENCQARCVTCDYWRSHHTQPITTERAKRLLVELHELGIDSVRFEGGEPLLRKDLFEVLDSCGKNWFRRVVLATNGLLLSRLAKEVNNSTFTNVTVSLDAIGERNDRIRGVKEYYDRVTKALPLIKKRIKIVSTFTNVLVPDLEALILYCRERGYSYDVNLPDKRMYFFSKSETRQAVDALWPSEQEVDRGLELLSRYNILPNYIIQNAREFLIKRTFKFNHCIQGYIEINIDSKGGVRTGCNVFEPVGNLLENDLKTIVGSRVYREAVEKMYRLDCPLCTCGYAISATYKKPWKVLGYALRRVTTGTPGR